MVTNTTVPSPFVDDPKKQTCLGSSFVEPFFFLTFISGLFGNVIIIKFVWSERRSTQVVSRILLLNSSCNNLLACCCSFPLLALSPKYLNWTGVLSNEAAEYLGAVRLSILFACHGVGQHLLALLCYDRYETLVKYNQHRILTHTRAKYIVAFVWVECFSSMTSIFFNQRIARPKQVVTPSNSTLSANGGEIIEIEKASTSALIGIVTVWLIVFSAVTSQSLRLVGLQIKHHLQSVRSTLGHMRSLEEINMVKVAAAFIVTYMLLWLPYGIARGLSLSLPSNTSECFFEVTSLLVYMTFSLIPLLYILTDKRIRARVKMNVLTCVSTITNGRAIRVNPS